MTPKAEIIAIGDEILYGQTLDTNSHWISGVLDEINVKVHYRTTIGDNREQMLEAFEKGVERSDIVLITGGLGPTRDDLTKPLLAEFFGVQMILNDSALEDIKSLFKKAGREMTDLNLNQAELPSNCIKITNKMGTAPGMWFEEKNTILVSMPGVPYEMKKMMKDFVLPKIQEKYGKGVIHHKIIKTIGIPESKLAEMIKDWEENLPQDIKLAYLPSLGQVKLRLTALGDNLEKLKSEVDTQIKELNHLVGKYIYGYDTDEIEGVIGKMLKEKNQTIATAESCTGGYLAHLITSIPGSSNYYKGSIISYSNDVKTDKLGVDQKILEEYGAVSEETVKQMAENVRKVLNTDVGLATSGIAGPDGGTAEKPVGTVWIAYSDSDKTIAKKLQLTKDRMLNIQWSAYGALNLFRLNYQRS